MDTRANNGRKERSRERKHQVKQRAGPWQRPDPDLLLLLFSLVAMPDLNSQPFLACRDFAGVRYLIFSLSKSLFCFQTLPATPSPSSALSVLSLPDWSDEPSDHPKRHHN